MLRKIHATLVAGLLVAGLANAQPMTYNDVRPMAQRDEQASPPEYVKKLETFYVELAKKTLPACREGVEKPDEAVVSVVSRIDENGKILFMWPLGQKQMTDCYVASLKETTLPPPPFQPYYTIVTMRGDPAKL